MPKVGQLVLSHDGLEVTLSEFEEYSRNEVKFATHERSTYGTVAIRRHLYESELLWQIKAILLKEEAQRLGVIVRKASRSWDLTDGSILLYDLIEEWVEESPQSRSIVPDQLIETREDTTIAYFAQFKVQLSDFKINLAEGRDDLRMIEFTATELERV